MIRNVAAIYIAVVLAAGFLLATGLITGWGQWYSEDLTYRFQTEALLGGSLSLGVEARDLSWDMVWAKGGVQQAWGLGVPLWRALFDGAAKMFGQPFFPDRIALGAAFAALAFGVLRLFVIPSVSKDPVEYLKKHPEGICAFFVLLLFPPFITLCRFRFAVYEEAAAYSYLAGVGLFAGVFGFLKNPRLSLFLGIALLAGLAPFVRPTLLAYSVASMVVLLFLAYRAGWQYRRLASGVLLFGIGGILLILSNQFRFGSGWEFGHSLNLNTVDSMRFTSRFDAPFRSEPLSAATVELASAMFLAGNRFNGFEWYGAERFFPGQSATHRWRELYFTTYDLTFALMLAVVWSLGVARGARWCWSRYRTGLRTGGTESRAAGSREFSVRDLMAVWSLLASGPIFLFYLQQPYMASRYILDFGPAFAVGVTGFLFAGAARARETTGRSWRLAVIVLLPFGLWWSWQIFSAESGFEAGRVLTREQVAARSVAPALRASFENLPERYEVEMDMDRGWPPFNTAGWDLSTGQTKAAITLFIPAVSQLVLDVAPTDGAEISDADVEGIRVKVGLEFLERKRIEEHGEGWRLSFAGPRNQRYQDGVQTAFLGFVSVREVSDGDSRFRLLRVDWEAAGGMGRR